MYFQKLCWSSHTLPGGEGRGHIVLNTAAIFHVHFQVVQVYEQILSKSLVGVTILRAGVEKDIALNTAALFPPWRRLKTSTTTVVSIP